MMNKDDSHKHNVDPKQQATKVNTFEVKVYKNEGIHEFMNTKFRMAATLWLERSYVHRATIVSVTPSLSSCMEVH